MSNLKQRLLAAAAVRSKSVSIDGEDYTVREVSAELFSEYGEAAKVSKTNAAALLISECLVDETGEKMLSSEEATLVAKSARLCVPLLNAIMEVSGFGDTEKKPDAS